MKWRVLISAPYILPVLDRFKSIFDKHGIEIVVPPVNERMEEQELLKWVSNIDGAICGDDRFTNKVLKSASKLKVISKWGTGIDSIDIETCHELDISVLNTTNAFSEPVADSVLGYILCFSRNLPWMNQLMKKGKWHKIPGRSLRECKIGIIGVGNVGKAITRRAIAFGMHVLGNDLVEMPSDFLRETNIEMLAIEELLMQADFVSLNCDLNPTSFHLMNEAAFSLMKTSAVLINTSRGPIVDELALIRVLENKRIAGAALDVFEEEPLPKDNPLLTMDNVMLAPHNSNSSPEAWDYVHQNTINNLITELESIK